MVRRWGAPFALGLLVASVLPACTKTANVSEVWLSIDQDGSRHRSSFYTDSANITCVAKIGVGRADVTFELLIRRIAEAQGNTDKFDTVNKVIASSESHPAPTPDGPTTIALTMVPTSVGDDGKLKDDADAPFTAGSYICEVYIDGTKEKTAAFNVDYATCPTIQIQQGTPCVGFYTEGTECPAGGASGDPTPKCACNAQRGWQCDGKK